MAGWICAGLCAALMLCVMWLLGEGLMGMFLLDVVVGAVCGILGMALFELTRRGRR
jgi:hypothetical protein